MEAKAVARYVRISPSKVRQVVDLIRGKDCDEALAILRFVPKAGAEPVEKRTALSYGECREQPWNGSWVVVRRQGDCGRWANAKEDHSKNARYGESDP